MKCLVVIGDILYEPLAEVVKQPEELTLGSQQTRFVVERRGGDWLLLACSEPPREVYGGYWIEVYIDAIWRRLGTQPLSEVLISFHSTSMLTTPPPNAVQHRRYENLEVYLRDLGFTAGEVRVRGYHGTANLCALIEKLPHTVSDTEFCAYLEAIRKELYHPDGDVTTHTQCQLQFVGPEEGRRALADLRHRIVALFIPLDFAIQGLADADGEARLAYAATITARYRHLGPHAVLRLWAEFECFLTGSLEMEGADLKLSLSGSEEVPRQAYREDSQDRRWSVKDALTRLGYEDKELAGIRIACGFDADRWERAKECTAYRFINDLDTAVQSESPEALLRVFRSDRTGAPPKSEFRAWFAGLDTVLRKISVRSAPVTSRERS